MLLAGMLGEDPPTDDAGMPAYAQSLPGPEPAEIIRTARPLGPAVKMRYPEAVRTHGEKDARPSFNPMYGQGVTVAAMEAALLRRLVAGGTEDLPRRQLRRNTVGGGLSSTTGASSIPGCAGCGVGCCRPQVLR
ncbi:hypothetical protein GCM10025331_79080 [Actinoplanes utahensis]|uniref:Uncharacterized protein n=1 Tax=Actinoplanes utahensis TaxID=1869 RepID=A0A0A6UHB0_ACTUT|nr:hypothetical protein MB27_26595 [Actinoplanes utahensis]